jgi:hypothetical protein
VHITYDVEVGDALKTRMNLHQKSGRLREETIDFVVNRWKREGDSVVNRFTNFQTIGIKVTLPGERINLEGNVSPAKIKDPHRLTRTDVG